MPQMSPMKWLIIYFMIIFNLIMIMSIIYFNFYKKNKIKLNYSNKLFLPKSWKWMW